MLTKFKTEIQELSLMQTSWAQDLNPIISLPILNQVTLTDVILKVGDNEINHRLGRKLRGWIVIRMKDNFTQLYDKQSSNQMQDLTLVLNSSATGLVDLLVF